MLVLSRKASESIQIGDDIVVTIVRISSGEVRVGIDAPTQVPILRGELQPECRIGAGSVPELAASRFSAC